MTLSLPSFTRFLVRAVSLLLLLLGTSLLTQAQSIRYVKPAATGAGNGSSWANASGDLQAMINTSGDYDQVWVAAGTYKPTTTTDRTISFAMRNGVAIYGGFTGNETSLSQRPAVNQATPSSTTLSGDIGTAGSNDDNSYHVIRNLPGMNTSAVLDGFVITGGKASTYNTHPDNSGGGMFNQGNYYDCNPLIRNCVFQGNSAAYGGAIYNEGLSSGISSPVLINCSFQNNSAIFGGAMFSGGSNAISSPVLTNCSFQNNSAAQIGGAMLNAGFDYGDSSPVLTNCLFQNNSADFGGAIYNEGRSNGTSSPVLTNCSLQGNSAASRGGAMYNYGTTNPTLANCVVFGNGIATTFSNQANSIKVTYSLLETGVTNFTDAGNNLTTTASPFVSATDARLNTCAPAINSGNNGANTTATDLAGNPRIFSSGGTATPDRIDMGAYEYQANLLTVKYVKMGGAGTGSGDSWANASGDLQATIQTSCENQQVWVAQGTYKPGPSTNTDRSLSFAMKNRVAIYGGFSATGNPSSLTARNPGSFTTVLSGDIGTAGDNADNSYHIINNPPGLNSSAVLDGFLITGGNANGNSPDDSGGGIINNGNGAGNTCSPLIRNCLFQNNTATNHGGALSNAGYNSGNSSPTLINCAFQSNSAAVLGGAIYNDGSVGGNSNPSLTNCSFQANSAPSGGAMGSVGFQGNSRPVLTNCVVWGNGGASSFNNGPGAFITTSYSLFESSVTGYSPGTGNLTTTTSPFASATDTQLSCGSAAIDAGDPATTAATVGPIDLAGNPRFFNGPRVDMGAYEAQGNSFSVVITATPSLTITTGQSATLSASGGSGQPADAYAWSTGATSNSIVVSVAGPYSVTAATTAGCSATASVTLTVNPPACGGGLSGPVWTGCLSTDWNTAGNWASGAVPTATDDVVIPSAPAKQPVLSTTATAKSVEVQSGASLIITAAGSLTINNSKSLDGSTTAFSNRGTVQNAGQLVLGNTAAIGQIGFWNFGIANNAGGQISIDRSTTSALRNSSGTFTNTGAITIGSTADVGNIGLQVVGGTVANNPGGDITINRTTARGLFNNATFVNASRLTIGNIALSAQDCIFSTRTFTNTTTGEIRADRARGNGIWNSNGTFRNDGKILIGTVAYTGAAGILTDNMSFVNSAGAEIQIDRVNRGLTNRSNFTNAGRIRMGNNVALGERGVLNGNDEGTIAAVFTNQAGGLIQIDQTASGQDGLTNNVMATFTNAGTVAIGTSGSIGGNGIGNAGTFSNSACATLTVAAPINNGNSLTNAGLFTVSTTRTHNNTGTLTNNGLISYPLGNPIPNVVNNDVIAGPTSSCSNTLTPALQLGVNSSQFSVGTTWYTDPALTQSAGTYDQGSNTFTATSLAPGSSTTLYVAATDNANGCTRTVSVSVTLNATVTASISPANPTLTCTSPTVSLTASGGSSYVWDDNSTNAVRTVSTSGTYSVTVSNGAGCSSVASVSVGQDNTTPVATLSASPSTTLTCAQTTLTLLAGGGDRYTFAGPGIVSQEGSQALVNIAGVYSVTVTSNTTGCFSVTSITISQDNTVPAVTITANPSLTITQGQSATLTARVNGGTALLTYGWSTGASTPDITASTAGPYSVTVSGANGCSASATATLSVTTAPVQPTGPFAITGVSTISCDPILPNRFSISFTPRYDGLNGQPLSFSVVNELLPTTQPGPYTLQLYTDNPVITLNAVQSGVGSSFAYNWLAACKSATTPNTPPRLVMAIPAQSATVGVGYSYVIPSGTFTDTETPGSLQLTASGLPPGLSFAGATLSGTPASPVGSPFSIMITATDPGGLSASTVLSLTVQPATDTPPPTMPFAITGVTTISCTPVANRINLVFAPRYAGMSGQSIAFAVVNELAPTTDAAPYSLTLYRDNPVITLKATQTGSAGDASFAYNWLAACATQGQDNTPPRVNQPVASQTATVGVGYSLNLANTFADQETPNQLSLVAAGLPAGLTLAGTTISGTASASGVSTVTITATDPGSLSVSTSFTITVVPVSVQPPTPPVTASFSLTGVTPVSCEVVSAGQRRVTFTPRYSGLDGSPVTFQVVNEKLPTTDAGPYTLNLYTDNPVITLQAVQSGVSSRFAYDWRAACTPTARLGSGEAGSGLQVLVLGNPVKGETVEVEIRGAIGESLEVETLNEQGYRVDRQGVESAREVERLRLRIGWSGGVYLLRVSSSSQTQTLKILKQ